VIRAVLLDLGRVIVPFEFDRAWSRIEALGGIPTDELRGIIQSTGLIQKFESGEVEPREFADRVSNLCNITVNFDEFSEIWSSIFLPETLIGEDLVAGLSRQYRLVLLSNTNALHFEMIRANYPLLKHFHSYVLSYQVGAMKPSPEIYRRAVEEAGCKPEECFFTDDIPAYVEGARQHGIDAVQFHDAAQLEAELRSRGIEWQAPTLS
jgi:putative hydrolase of the HAD superfamily